jgi:hypothetical protein
MTNAPLPVVCEPCDRPDDIEVTPAMIEAGVDLAVDLGVENVDLYALAELLYQRMALASRGQLVHKFAPVPLAHPREISV